MRAQDRTLLASLGFADADKGDARHDLACRYLAQPEITEVFARRFHQPETVNNVSSDSLEREAVFTKRGVLRNPYFEFPISKGSGQYKTTIGFVDLILGFDVFRHTVGRFREKKKWFDPKVPPHGAQREEWTEWKELDADDLIARPHIVIEVKIGEVGMGQVLRQLNLYKEYLGQVLSSFEFALVTAFPIDQGEMLQLRSAGIDHFTLGEGFDRFCAANDGTTKPSDSPQL